MTTPRVTVVIPVMGHPVLVDDAIASAAALMDQGAVARIIVVNDGCRYAETRAALSSWAALLGPAKLTVVPQANRGLSAARNAGIDLALADPAGLPDAIFLLDADNRLAPSAAGAFAALLQTRPEVDWFYPSFDFFGQEGHYATEAAPSGLMHMLVNHSEAGSLIRTRVFAAGLRFSEDLRQGYEDWDFFLNASAQGFIGAPAGRPLLQYRKRPSSMLAESHELDTRLREELRQRHNHMRQTRALLAQEAAQFPRYALVGDPSDGALVGSDPASLRPIPHDALIRTIFQHLGAPLRHHAPPFIVVMAASLREVLQQAGLLRGVLWNIERRFARDEGCAVATVALEASDGSLAWREDASGDTAPAIVVLGPATIARAARQGEVPGNAETLQSGARAATLSVTGTLLAALHPHGQDAAGQALDLLRALRDSRFRDSLALSWDWRDTGGARPRADVILAPRIAARGGVVLPLTGTPGARLDIGFTLPIFDQGGVEKVVLQLTRVLRDAGHACHLFIVGGRPARLRADEAALFASINFFPDPSSADWAGTEYFGTAETSWGNPQERADLEGLLRPLDLVIDAHCAAVHKVAASLRRGGTHMADHEHLVEISQYGRAYGPPMLAMAYENAYDRILTCSAGLADWLSARGVPRDKLMPVVNAPGYPMTSDEIATALARRADPCADRPLSILYLGRLDEQKGIDRVAAVFSALSAEGVGGGPRFRLTVGGRAVVGHAAAAEWPVGTRVLGAVEGGQALTEAFTAADILILPSRYEGLPLVLLEAQRLGCVPIATDVGAVREAIADGETGLVVHEDGCAAAITDIVLGLDRDRDALKALSQAASAASRDWHEAARPLLDWCEAISDSRAAMA